MHTDTAFKQRCSVVNYPLVTTLWSEAQSKSLVVAEGGGNKLSGNLQEGFLETVSIELNFDGKVRP